MEEDSATNHDPACFPYMVAYNICRTIVVLIICPRFWWDCELSISELSIS